MSNRSLNIGPPVSVGTLDHNSRYAATLEAAVMELAPSHRSTGTKCAATIKGKGSLVLWFRENLATKPNPVFRSVKEVAREETEVIEADRAILKVTPNTTLTTQERAHLLGAAFQQAAREYNAPADNYDVRFTLSETLMHSPRDMNLDEKAMQLTKKSLMNVAWPGNVIIATATQVDWIVPRINKGRALKEITNTGSAHNRGSDAVCGPHSAVAKSGARTATATTAASAADSGGSGLSSGSIFEDDEVNFSGVGIHSDSEAEGGSGSAARPATAAAVSGGSDDEVDFSGAGIHSSNEDEEGEGISELGMTLFKYWARCANDQQLIEAEATTSLPFSKTTLNLTLGPRNFKSRGLKLICMWAGWDNFARVLGSQKSGGECNKILDKACHRVEQRSWAPG